MNEMKKISELKGIPHNRHNDLVLIDQKFLSKFGIFLFNH